MIYWLVFLKVLLTRQGLFYTYRLANHVYISSFEKPFLKSFLHMFMWYQIFLYKKKKKMHKIECFQVYTLSHFDDIRHLRNYNAYEGVFACLHFVLSDTSVLCSLEELTIREWQPLILSPVCSSCRSVTS